MKLYLSVFSILDIAFISIGNSPAISFNSVWEQHSLRWIILKPVQSLSNLIVRQITIGINLFKTESQVCHRNKRRIQAAK